MAQATSSNRQSGRKFIAQNRKARHDYHLEDSFEAGMVLTGTEVKSLRAGHATIDRSFADVRDAQIWLVGAHIAPYEQASVGSHDPDRDRKLLMNRDEIQRLKSRVDQERLALIPLSLYFKNGRAKVELGLGKGRRRYDKRQLLAERDADLEARRHLRARER